MEMYFLIGFIILYGLVNVHYTQPEFGLTIAIIPVMIIQVACTIISTKYENMLGAIGAIVSSQGFLRLSLLSTHTSP